MPKNLQGEVRESQNRIGILSGLQIFLNCDAETGLGERSGTVRPRAKVRRQLVWVSPFPGKVMASQRPWTVCFQEDLPSEVLSFLQSSMLKRRKTHV